MTMFKFSCFVVSVGVLISAAFFTVPGCSRQKKQEAEEVKTAELTGARLAGSSGPRQMREKKPQEIEEVSTRIANLVAENAAENRGEVIKLILKLAELDPESALRALSILPEDYATWYMIGLHQKLGEKDPAGCALWLSKFQPDSGQKKNLAANIFGILAREDPDRAFDSIKNLRQDIRASIIAQGAVVWAQKIDPETAIADVKLRLSGAELDAALGALTGSVAIKDPQRAFTLTEDFPAALKIKALPDIFGFWVRKEGYGAIIDSLKTCDPGVIQKVLDRNNVIERMASESPKQAVDILSLVVFTSENSSIFEKAAKNMAKADPLLALQWVDGFPQTAASDSLVKSIFDGWAEGTLAGAKDAAASIKQEKKAAAFEGIGGGLSRASFDDGIELLSGLESTDAQAFFKGFSQGAAARGPEAIIQLLSDSRIDSVYRNSEQGRTLLCSAMEQIAKNDSSAALRAMEGIPDEQKAEAVYGIVSGWSRSNPQAASKWLLDLPPGASRNHGIEAMAAAVASTDPEAAESWRSLLR